MAQNEPERKETPPGTSPNSPSLLFEYQCRSGKFIRLAKRIESNRNFFSELECSTRQHCDCSSTAPLTGLRVILVSRWDRNQSAPIQLSQCRFPGLAISNANIYIYIYIYIFERNIREQFYQTALGNCYGLKLAKCWLQFNFRHTFVPYRCASWTSRRGDWKRKYGKRKYESATVENASTAT